MIERTQTKHLKLQFTHATCERIRANAYSTHLRVLNQESGPGVPKTETQMIAAAATAVRAAFQDGKTRQKLRSLRSNACAHTQILTNADRIKRKIMMMMQTMMMVGLVLVAFVARNFW